jgi:hypothetical protein
VDIARAFTYVFDDDDWVGKIVMVIVWTFISAIPLVGLVGFAALAGYVIELIQNMQQGSSRPLPRWDNLGDKMGNGFNVLIAWIVYNIPNFLLACGFIFLMPSFGVSNGDGAPGASGAALAVTCCLTLILLGYNLIIWPLLALGTIRYARVGQITAYFQVSDLWATINRHLGQTGQWLIFTIFASIILGFLNVVPCIGWLATLALTVPVQGHLLAQFAVDLDKRKNKPKRT